MDFEGNQPGSTTVSLAYSSPLTAYSTMTAAAGEWVWLSMNWTWWLIVQLILSIIGIVGNFLVIAVIIRRGRSQFSSDVLIAGLAVADLSTSIWMIPHRVSCSLPPDWKGRMYCRLVYSNVFMWISAAASVFILTAISMERFMAVKYPFRFKSWFNVRRSLLVVGLSWFLATVINIFTLAISVHDEASNTCETIPLTKELHMAIGVLLFALKYLLPIVVMIVSHLAIIADLRALTRSLQIDGGDVPSPAMKLLETMRNLTRTVLIVVIVFIICWTPDQVCFLLFNLDLYPSYIHSYPYHVFVCLTFVNSCCNPFIYSVKNEKFRQALFDLLCLSSARRVSSLCCRKAKSENTEPNSRIFRLAIIKK